MKRLTKDDKLTLRRGVWLPSSRTSIIGASMSSTWSLAANSATTRPVSSCLLTGWRRWCFSLAGSLTPPRTRLRNQSSSDRAPLVGYRSACGTSLKNHTHHSEQGWGSRGRIFHEMTYLSLLRLWRSSPYVSSSSPQLSSPSTLFPTSRSPPWSPLLSPKCWNIFETKTCYNNIFMELNRELPLVNSWSVYYSLDIALDAYFTNQFTAPSRFSFFVDLRPNPWEAVVCIVGHETTTKSN